MHLTIHIGPHKTGTTALQTACAKGARRLERAGVLYPKVCWQYPAHHRLALAGKGRRMPGGGSVPDLEAEFDQLARTLREARVSAALISSEEFFAWPPEVIERLVSLPVDGVRILTFLRRPDAFLVSSYNQKIRQVGNGFHPPIRRFVRDPWRIAPEIDYATCIGRWADAFGEEAITLEVYEDGPVLPRALASLGLPPDLLPNPPGINSSVPGAVVECLRHAKAAGFGIEAQRRLARRAGVAFADHPPFFLAEEDRQAILKALEPSNDALFARFGRRNPFASAETLCDEDWRQNLCNQDLVRLIGQMI